MIDREHADTLYAGSYVHGSRDSNRVDLVLRARLCWCNVPSSAGAPALREGTAPPTVGNSEEQFGVGACTSGWSGADAPFRERIRIYRVVHVDQSSGIPLFRPVPRLSLARPLADVKRRGQVHRGGRVAGRPRPAVSGRDDGGPGLATVSAGRSWTGATHPPGRRRDPTPNAGLPHGELANPWPIASGPSGSFVVGPLRTKLESPAPSGSRPAAVRWSARGVVSTSAAGVARSAVCAPPHRSRGAPSACPAMAHGRGSATKPPPTPGTACTTHPCGRLLTGSGRAP